MPQYAAYDYIHDCRLDNPDGIKFVGQSETLSFSIDEIMRGSGFDPLYWYNIDPQSSDYTMHSADEKLTIANGDGYLAYFAVNEGGDILDFTDAVARLADNAEYLLPAASSSDHIYYVEDDPSPNQGTSKEYLPSAQILTTDKTSFVLYKHPSDKQEQWIKDLEQE